MKETDNKDKALSNQHSPLRGGLGGCSIFLKLFSTFFRIGAFTLGGGYAMIPLIQAEVVEKNKWVKEEDFVDLIAIAQSCPGVFAANIATFIGYKVKGEKGALCTTLGTVLPSFIIILLIAMVFRQFMQIHWIAAMFNGIRPAVVALIAAPTFNLAKSAKIHLGNVWIPIASAILICGLGVNPIWIIIAAGVGGFVYGRLKASPSPSKGGDVDCKKSSNQHKTNTGK